MDFFEKPSEEEKRDLKEKKRERKIFIFRLHRKIFENMIAILKEDKQRDSFKREKSSVLERAYRRVSVSDRWLTGFTKDEKPAWCCEEESCPILKDMFCSTLNKSSFIFFERALGECKVACEICFPHVSKYQDPFEEVQNDLPYRKFYERIKRGHPEYASWFETEFASRLV